MPRKVTIGMIMWRINPAGECDNVEIAAQSVGNGGDNPFHETRAYGARNLLFGPLPPTSARPNSRTTQGYDNKALASCSSFRIFASRVGYARCKRSNVSTTAEATTSRMYHLLSAGTMYQGAFLVEVWRMVSS